MFVRQCPTCGKELTYKCERGLKRATKHNSVCKNCSQRGKRNSKQGTFTRQCPNCNEKMFYSNKGNLKRATEKNSICLNCANKDKHTGKTLPEEWRRNLSIARGGDGNLDKDRFNDSKLLQWSRRVRKRDCHCQKCNSTENLEAHHIIDKIIMPDLAYEEWNGITLCKPCHIELHKELV